MKYFTKSEHRLAALVLIVLFSPLLFALIYTKLFVMAGLLWAFCGYVWFITLPKKDKPE